MPVGAREVQFDMTFVFGSLKTKWPSTLKDFNEGATANNPKPAWKQAAWDIQHTSSDPASGYSKWYKSKATERVTRNINIMLKLAGEPLVDPYPTPGGP